MTRTRKKTRVPLWNPLNKRRKQLLARLLVERAEKRIARKRLGLTSFTY